MAGSKVRPEGAHNGRSRRTPRATHRSDVDQDRVRAALPSKLEAKDLSVDAVTAERLVERKAEFESDWHLRGPLRDLAEDLLVEMNDSSGL
ncbi:MAG: hypothetical protein GEU90_11945 [Gemmatimonas sp.]|nr:hypothetical protein [Gemmatimonas sp.]